MKHYCLVAAVLSVLLPVMGGGRSTQFVPRRAGAPCAECAKLRRALCVLKGRDLEAAKRVHAEHMKTHRKNQNNQKRGAK